MKQQVEETRLKRKNKEFKKAKSYREILPRVGLKFKTSLGLKRGSPTKFLLISPRLVRIGCITIGPKGEEVEIQ